MSTQPSTTAGRDKPPKPRYSPRTSARFRTKAFRLLTAPWRVQPNFIIIGAQRSGTTSLFEYLAQHQSVVPGLYKEIRYFTDRWHLGSMYYRACFPTRREMQQRISRTGAAMTFDATPEYMFDPIALDRIKRVLPNIKLVAILRDPIERTISAYRRAVRLGHEPLSFEQAIDAEDERLKRQPGESDSQYYCGFRRRHFSYKSRSLYAPQLKRVLEVFDRDQIHVMCFETLVENPEKHFSDLLRFLNLPPCSDIEFAPHHKGYGKKPSIAPEMLKRLQDEFAPHNAELREMFGDLFPWASKVSHVSG